jgi:hypothetical protein
MDVRAFFRGFRALGGQAKTADEEGEDAQLVAIQREVERGLEALRRAQEEAAGGACSGRSMPPAPKENDVVQARATK